jgi:hypothetical protein
MPYFYELLGFVVYMRNGYGGLRIFPRDISGYMGLLHKSDLQKYSVGIIDISH